MSDAEIASVLSLDVNDATASESGLTTSGADEEVHRLENKRQSPSLSPSPTSALSDAEAWEVAEVRVAGTYYRIGPHLPSLVPNPTPPFKTSSVSVQK